MVSWILKPRLKQKSEAASPIHSIHSLDDPPPLIIKSDIGYCFDLYATFDGTWNYRAFPDALSSRIYLTDIARVAFVAVLLLAVTNQPKRPVAEAA